ncbi:uncharacterized protein N0V89_009729 [Didymosphaeria variabile]|uniref:Uncharacterized protein n=1 Tax=Didymosphaeria variabile TaxID=1932322 RepID=A0A9W8XEA5_9PLEO|nr:uncharacterized protein N0V89_009729 [Didymosphaeria variabile]KAJ4348355.1 hypothetical protein N0V89_009729 [Didymosphaeria variabile]
MARLRKPSPTEQVIFIPPPTPTTRSTRTSPRKTMCKSPSTRKLRYTSPEDSDEGSFLVPKAPINQSPVRKQRVLRPMASNASLVQRPSTESLRSLVATPDKDRRPRRPLRDGGSAANHLYSKTLAKIVARKKGPLNIAPSEFEGTVVDERDVEQSIVCGDTNEANDEDKENTPKKEKSDDDVDDEPVVDARRRRKQPRARRRVVSDSEEDEDENYDDAVMSQHTQTPVPEPAWKPSVAMPPPPLVSNRPPFRKGHSIISNWAQDVIDLTESPEPQSSFAIPPTCSSTHRFFCRFVSYKQQDVEPPSKLASPSKKNARIPNSVNLRPSIDAFWDPEIVNDHVDKFSPSKPLLSPRKQNLFKQLEKQTNSITLSDDDSDSIPSPHNFAT